MATGIHPFHDIPCGPEKKFPDVVNGVIEIPQGSKVKYEVDKDTGMLFVDRVLYSSTCYPHNYGFIPRTYCDDGDALDILVLMQAPVPPLSFCRAKPIGAMRMMDCGEQDDKIIAVCADDPAYKHYEDITELPPHRWKEIRSFFMTYKRGQLEEKYGKKRAAEATFTPSDEPMDGTTAEDCEAAAVTGVMDPFKDEPLSPTKAVHVEEEMIGAEEAKRIILDSQRMYDEYMAKKKEGQ